MMLQTWAGSYVPFSWRIIPKWLRGWLCWCLSADTRAIRRRILEEDRRALQGAFRDGGTVALMDAAERIARRQGDDSDV